ncbi:MAG TPA: cysteine peptidase family C39 domain-containing protein [Thermoanaerobaculia bacterium]|nr:cysteine peptidase family C39 domain-containing protein [Thermoanaerobaculia bacterium]
MNNNGTRRRRALLALSAITAAAVFLGTLPLTASHLAAHRTLIKVLRAKLDGAEYIGDDGVVLQPRRNDCGAACLKMVLSTHGIDSDLAALEKAAKTAADGASLADLRKAAAAKGLPGKAWMLNEADLARAPLPALVFVRNDHFVVVRKFVSRNVLIVDDPAIGRLRWPMASFRKVWRGESLIFDPNWDPAMTNKIVSRAPAQ